MRTVIVFSPSYSDESGGVIALHKLCHIVNTIGGKAFLVPYFETYRVNKLDRWRDIFRVCNRVFNERMREFRPEKFKTNPGFISPVLRALPEDGFGDDHIVVYPEITFGNPLRARNVVRWLLHNPGVMSHDIFYGPGEMYFRFHSGVKEFAYPGSMMSKHLLRVIHFPRDVYNKEGASQNRKGTAYCVRKGTGKKIVHDLSDSVLIDGKSHSEVAAIFKRVKMFISYDTYTAYSRFAALCGCDSVIVPDEGVCEEEWHPDPTSRYGLAYGFENLQKARETEPMMEEAIEREHAESIAQVKDFIGETEEFFSRGRGRGDMINS